MFDREIYLLVLQGHLRVRTRVAVITPGRGFVSTLCKATDWRKRRYVQRLRSVLHPVRVMWRMDSGALRDADGFWLFWSSRMRIAGCRCCPTHAGWQGRIERANRGSLFDVRSVFSILVCLCPVGDRLTGTMRDDKVEAVAMSRSLSQSPAR